MVARWNQRRRVSVPSTKGAIVKISLYPQALERCASPASTAMANPRPTAPACQESPAVARAKASPSAMAAASGSTRLERSTASVRVIPRSV